MSTVREVLQAIVLAPEDKLVIVWGNGPLTPGEDKEIQEAIDSVGLDGRVLSVSGVKQLAVLRGEPS